MIDRRSFLKALGAGGTALGMAGCGKPDPRPLTDPRPETPDAWQGLGEADPTAFPQGVQAGDPQSDGLILWTRAGLDDQVELLLARAVDGTWVEDPAVPCTVRDGGFVHHEVALEPDQPVAFQFRDGAGRLSPVGMARSAPAEDANVVVTLAATSCASQGHGDFPSMPAALARGPIDAWCWLGDTLYNDGVTNEAGYRANWQAQLSREGFQSVMSSTACIYTWDDHEVTNDWGDTVYGSGVDPNRLSIAYEAFFDHTPSRRDPNAPRRLFRSFRMGKTAEVFVLDCRGERDEQGGIYISQAQMDWLKNGLSTSTAPWKLILNSVPITDLPEIYDLDRVIRDRWEGYGTQRAELLEHIVDNGLSGVLFVSGDVHHGTFCRIDPPGGVADQLLEIFTGPAGSTRNPLGALLEDEAQFLWSDAVWNCTRISLHPGGFCQITVVGEEDETYLDTLFDIRGQVYWLESQRGEDSR